MHIHLRGILATASVAFALLFTAGAQAELSRVTLGEGTGAIDLTHDTASGLDWLDVRLTSNQTYDQVRTGSYYKMGFRHATQTELQALFTQAGLIDDWFDLSFTQPAEALALASLLGATIDNLPSRKSTLAFVGSDYFGQDITLETHPIGVSFSALLGKVDYLDLGDGWLVGEAHFTGGHPFSDQAAPEYGSFLVRPSVCRTVGGSANPKCDGQGRGQYR